MKFKLRPELDKPKYWLHLPIISLVVLGLLELSYGGEMFTLKNIVLGAGLIAVGDIVAHTLLGLN